ncbi:MAG TPA: class I SAM-dependent methyltransferase [Streptosporangiaceae bacterium]|jgi:O-methyltransferase involved in polyketide biosynthesis
MTGGKVHFTEEQSTGLGTLYGRALDARKARPILGDPTAEDAVSRIDYDFGTFKMRDSMAVSVAVRAKLFDDLVRTYLSAHPDATVLHLGCGMDSRVFRIDPPPTVRWFDVDYPDVIALREAVYPYGDRPGYTTIGSSVTDPDWLARVPADKPALVVAEGLTMYLDPAEGRALLRALVAHFPSGEMIFDVFSGLAIKLQKTNPVVRRTNATLRWGIDDPRELEPLGLTVVDRRLAAEMIPDSARAVLPASYRFQFALLKVLPMFRTVAQLVHVSF